MLWYIPASLVAAIKMLEITPIPHIIYSRARDLLFQAAYFQGNGPRNAFTAWFHHNTFITCDTLLRIYFTRRFSKLHRARSFTTPIFTKRFHMTGPGLRSPFTPLYNFSARCLYSAISTGFRQLVFTEYCHSLPWDEKPRVAEIGFFSSSHIFSGKRL